MMPRAQACAPAMLAILLIAASALAGAAPSIETHVHPTSLAVGETASLLIRLRGPLRLAEPDLTPLERDFTIEDVARSQRQSISNGVQDESVDWVVVLRPLGDGTLEIPELSVGDSRTTAGSVVVSPPRTNAQRDAVGDARGEPISLRMTTDRPNPYEQERVVLRVRLLVDAPVLEGSLGEPRIEGASVERLGEDRSFTETLDGRDYQGIEREYAVIPSAAGPLRIPPVSFEALLRDARARTGSFGLGRGFFGDFFAGSGFADDIFDRFLGGPNRRVTVRSAPLTLNVRPKPPGNEDRWWLPARKVVLEESWSEGASSAKVGEVLTRRITLRADGAAMTGLPALSLPALEGAKQYAEAPQGAEGAEGAVRVQDATLIPTRAGPLHIPSIDVHWWDVDAEVARVARLPERTIQVVGSVANPQDASSPAAAEPVVASEPLEVALAQSGVGSEIWLLMSFGLLAIGAVLWVLWRRPPASAWRHVFRARRALKRACLRSDPEAAERAIRQLRTLDASRTDWGLLRTALAELDAVQYSRFLNDWDGPALWTAYRNAVRRATTTGSDPRAGLPPLYPEARSPNGSARAT